jgi:hypothetical protein
LQKDISQISQNISKKSTGKIGQEAEAITILSEFPSVVLFRGIRCPHPSGAILKLAFGLYRIDDFRSIPQSVITA